MQDSIELPSDQDPQQINFFVSPNNSLKKQQTYHLNTGSQQSLAYSSETHAKYENSHRSPSQVQIPNFQTSEKPASLKRMIRAANISFEKSPSLNEVKSESQILTAFNKESHIARQDRRKTVHNKQYSVLSKKYKQMQYALHLQVITSQELRTKVAILTQLLEQKMKNSELAYFLALKNSSKNMKNIDIFMELKQAQKKLKQTQLTVEQQRYEIQRLVDQCTLRSSRKQNINSGNTDPQAEIEALRQEKQSLFSYIEELRKEYKQKNTQYQQIFQQLQRYQEKQQKFITLQRPKLIQQISQRSTKIKELRQEIEQVKMQKNLIELNYQNEIEQMRNNKKQKAPSLSVSTMTVQKASRSSQAQTQFANDEMQLLKAELKLLKSERDYYIQQYKKRIQQNSQNYLLKLQVRTYEKNIKQ